MRWHVIALRRCAQDHHQRAADYNAAALALFTALLLFRCTTIVYYTVICSWACEHRVFGTSILQHGTYTKNALITRPRFGAVHAWPWRAPHEVEGGEEARCNGEYSPYRVKPMQ